MSLTQIKDFFIVERSIKNASTQAVNDPFPHLEGRFERAWLASRRRSPGRVAPETALLDRGIVIWLVIKAFHINCSIKKQARQSVTGHRLASSRRPTPSTWTTCNIRRHNDV
jgi:hypothetical protein